MHVIEVSYLVERTKFKAKVRLKWIECVNDLTKPNTTKSLNDVMTAHSQLSRKMRHPILLKTVLINFPFALLF